MTDIRALIRGGRDTVDIAELLGKTEAEIYNRLPGVAAKPPPAPPKPEKVDPAWCPSEWLPEYWRLTKLARLSPDEAKRVIQTTHSRGIKPAELGV